MSGLIANTYATPQWLTTDFLQSALREGCRRGSLNVSTCTIRPATNVGDHYLSQMFRASARIHSARKGSEDMSVVIKSMPQGEVVEKFMNEQKFFTIETKMLVETLPLMQQALDEVGGQRICARLYFQQDAPNTSLVLEDLCESGFRSVNRLNFLDMDHSLLVMEYLAIFHAASLVAIERNPEIKENYKETCMWQRNNVDRVKNFINQDVGNFLLCLNEWQNFPKEMAEKIESWREKGAEKVLKCTDIKEDELNVLNHGDPWTSNIMFRYDADGRPVDLRMVDFQLSCYNSPACDIIYFIFTSVQADIKVSRIDEMLLRYHEKLVEMCSRLKYPLDKTFADTKKMVYDRMAFAFLTTMVCLPFMLMDSSDAPDMNKYLEEGQEDRGEKLSKNMRFKKIVETVLPFCDQHGVFD